MNHRIQYSFEDAPNSQPQCNSSSTIIALTVTSPAMMALLCWLFCCIIVIMVGPGGDER